MIQLLHGELTLRQNCTEAKRTGASLMSSRQTARVTTRRLAPGLMADPLAFRVRSLISVLSERVVVAFAPFGLRHGSFTSMALISANPGCSQTDSRAGRRPGQDLRRIHP